MENPKVSVIMATYNHASFISEAISSVQKQSMQDWELIIIDDGSVDTTKDVVGTFLQDTRIRYIVHEENKGVISSRNEALYKAQGMYSAILDSDDVWLDPDKLKDQVAECEKRACVVVGTGLVYIDASGHEIKKELKPENDEEIRDFFLYKNPFVHSSLLFVTEIAREVGGYRNFAIGEDYELVLRLGKKGMMYNIPKYSVQYRVHRDNISSKRMIGLSENLRIVKLFKHQYPHYYRALLRRWVRYVLGKIIL